ncbi:YcaO-like family protein [Desulfococcaceae bacterium OttesenSCG-928-F15]|nr:YcaO-like family protein [Desulfococcaceae bacterium OttesenSCG-928-F15]
MIHYIMKHKLTEGTTGYFRPVPRTEPELDETLRLCRQYPEDSFLRAWLIEKILNLADEKKRQASLKADSFLLHALKEAEHALGTNENLIKNEEVPGFSPLAYLRISIHPENRIWIDFAAKNILHLHFPEKLPETAPHTLSGPKLRKNPTPIAAIPPRELPSPHVPSLRDLFYAAMEQLKNEGLLMESERRHTASLSPFAILRQWDLDRIVEIPGYTHRLTGLQTSYGRGLDLETARVACLMEAAERITAFAGVSEGEVADRKEKTPLQRASFAELSRKKVNTLNPAKLLLEAPMPEATSLWWMPGEEITQEGKRECLVPAQCVLLFANLPEPQLFTALGSTGFASGSSEEGARLSGLLEVIERDADATMPHNPIRCFRIRSKDPAISGLLEAYAKQGVHPFFEDITSEFGIPAYRCLVFGENTVSRGTGCHLCGKKALVSALTETPWPFSGPPSQEIPFSLPERDLENLPDFSSGNPAMDLDRVERCLLANGYMPIHVPLTRKDLRIPVVRSIIPGLEILGDFDRFSTVNRRLYTRYQQVFDNRP